MAALNPEKKTHKFSALQADVWYTTIHFGLTLGAQGPLFLERPTDPAPHPTWRVLSRGLAQMHVLPSSDLFFGKRISFNKLRIVSHLPVNSYSIIYLYFLAFSTFAPAPFLFSLRSMREITRQAARLVPTTFLNATERMFLSSTVNSSSPNFEN